MVMMGARAPPRAAPTCSAPENLPLAAPNLQLKPIEKRTELFAPKIILSLNCKHVAKIGTASFYSKPKHFWS